MSQQPSDTWSQFQNDVQDLLRQLNLPQTGTGVPRSTASGWLNTNRIVGWDNIGQKVIEPALQRRANTSFLDALTPPEWAQADWWQRRWTSLNEAEQRRVDQAQRPDQQPSPPGASRASEEARPTPGPHEDRNRRLLILALACVGLIIAGAAFWAVSSDSSPTPGPTTPTPRPDQTATTSFSPAPSDSPTITATPPTVGPASGRTVDEIADNRKGIKVFKDAFGTPSTFQDIPFNTVIPVACWTRNNSDMRSLANGLYLIGAGPWKGGYAPSDTFANGDPVGGAGNTTRDPNVPDCHP